MRKHLAAGMVAALLTVCSVAAHAQPGPRGPAGDFGWRPGKMGPDGLGFICNPRAAGFAEWRIERIETAVKPTETQRTALNELRTASTKAAEIIAAACPKEYPAKSNERLALMEKRLEAMLEAIKAVRPAFEAFYGTLDDAQKARLDAAAPRNWGWHGWRWHWGG
jgi:hypothetical protein